MLPLMLARFVMAAAHALRDYAVFSVLAILGSFLVVYRTAYLTLLTEAAPWQRVAISVGLGLIVGVVVLIAFVLVVSQLPPNVPVTPTVPRSATRLESVTCSACGDTSTVAVPGNALLVILSSAPRSGTGIDSYRWPCLHCSARWFVLSSTI